MKKQNKRYSIIPQFSIISFVIMMSFFLVTPTFAEQCTGTDRTGTPTPYGCDPTQMNALQNSKPDSTTTKTTDSTTTKTTDSTTGVNINTGIKNPLGSSVSDIPSFIGILIDFVLLIGVPIVALALIYSGFLFVTSLGNSEKLTKAKKTFLYTLIGAAILLGAFVIAKAIKGTVDCIVSSTNTCN